MSMICHNLNDLVNLANKESEEATTLASRELENERDALRELHHKALNELKVCNVEDSPHSNVEVGHLYLGFNL